MVPKWIVWGRHPHTVCAFPCALEAHMTGCPSLCNGGSDLQLHVILRLCRRFYEPLLRISLLCRVLMVCAAVCAASGTLVHVLIFQLGSNNVLTCVGICAAGTQYPHILLWLWSCQCGTLRMQLGPHSVQSTVRCWHYCMLL
jgi:hypothetical protein